MSSGSRKWSGDLAAAWLNAPDRNAVTRAAHTIDLMLQRDPENAGESRDEGRRILLVPPLGVDYEVFPDKLEVHVLSLWSY